MLQSALFYLFAGTLLGASLGVIMARQAVHSVLFLIVAFLNASGLFILLGAEFLAFTLAIVYVGAVAVLFLFVVMTLDINVKVSSRAAGIASYTGAGVFVALVLAGELITVGVLWRYHKEAPREVMHPIRETLTNAHAIGEILYIDYFYLFQLSGIILLVAIIGAIVLTLRTQPRTRHQNYQAQLNRSPMNSLEMISVKSGEGVKCP